MAAKKRQSRTAAELMAELAQDPEYRARVVERDARIDEADAAYRQAEQPVVAALSRAGVSVRSVWDLVNEAAPYPAAVPTLLEHLQLPYPDRVREGIARALAVPEARSGWAILVAELEKSTDETTLGAKYGIALALSAAADDTVLGDIVRLLREPRHRFNRLPLLEPLARSKHPDARGLLATFADDAELSERVSELLLDEAP